MTGEQNKPKAKRNWFSFVWSIFSSSLLQRSGKENIRKNEEIEATPALDRVNEPFKSPVALASMSAKVQGGWSQLPPELLQDIAILLSEISDQVRFRVVCMAWRAAVHLASAPKFSCIPCPAFVKSSKTSYCTTSTLLSFIFSGIFSDSDANLDNLGVLSGRICGSGHGWLVVVSDLNTATHKFSVFLLNPLNGCLIKLPSIDSLINLESARDFYHAYELSSATIALLDGSKSLTTGCIVMITWRQHYIAYSQYRGENQEEKWTTLKLDLVSPDDYIASLAYHRGMIFALCTTGKILLVDTASHLKTIVDTPFVFKAVTFKYCTNAKIVETSGEIFLISYLWNEVTAYFFRLDLTVQPPCWQQTKDIGDHVLFVDSSQFQCVTMSDHVKSNLRKNCIYSIGTRENESLTYSICIIQLDKGIAEEIPLTVKSCTRAAIWFLPSLI